MALSKQASHHAVKYIYYIGLLTVDGDLPADSSVACTTISACCDGGKVSEELNGTSSESCAVCSTNTGVSLTTTSCACDV